MTLIKFKPQTAREILRDSMFSSNLMNVVDSMFNDAAAKFERNVFFTPRTDVVETKEAYEVHITLPGLKKEEINIDIEGDVLTISGERKMANETKEEKYHMVESYYGKFSRSFNLPEYVDKQQIEASLTDGILKLHIPKIEVKENKSTIAIK
jgi:HSP20 family protein